MIPKAELLAVAREYGLRATTIEKDHALGWMLFGIGQHPVLGNWIFKGGTCLKKCYFDTYRFSEDLDFTLPEDATLQSIREGLRDLAQWVSHNAGLEVLEGGIDVEASLNKLGQVTYLAKVTFRGPLYVPRQNRQRVKFDLTSHELVGLAPVQLSVFHPYSDRPDSAPLIRCYALEEVLAEKTRALVERSGRARDVYDVVNIGRNFRQLVDVRRARDLAGRKFSFKGLQEPTPEGILAAIDRAVLAADWENALRHQVRVLPPVDEFLAALGDVLRWLLLPEHSFEVPSPIPLKGTETAIPVEAFARALPTFGWGMDRIRFAARNRLTVDVKYHGIRRLVEPYSLRRPSTGNTLLYVFELRRGTGPGEGIKAFKVEELEEIVVTDQSFRPRYLVEL